MHHALCNNADVWQERVDVKAHPLWRRSRSRRQSGRAISRPTGADYTECRRHTVVVILRVLTQLGLQPKQLCTK